MFLMSLANDLARRESMIAFLCFVVAHLEWPDMLPVYVSCLLPRAAGQRATIFCSVRRLRFVVVERYALRARSLPNGVSVVVPFTGLQ